MMYRIDYLEKHMAEMKKAVVLDDEGNGSLSRYKRKTFNWYKEVIVTNGAKIN